MKLVRLEISNYRKVTAINVDINDNIVEFTGANASGKSSTLSAPWVLLKGAAVAPPTPIHAGAEQATIKGTFKGKDVGLIVTRTFKTSERDAKGWTSKLEVTNLEGLTSRVPPQQQLDAIIGEHRLDPIEFINLDDKSQLKAFRSLVASVDFDAIEELNDIDYAKRTEVGRTVTRLNGAAAAIVVPDMTPEQEVDVNELAEKLKTAGEENTKLETRKANRAKVAADVKNFLDARAANLEKIKELEETIANLRIGFDSYTKQASDAQARIDAAPPLPEPISTTLITQQIADANTINVHVRNRKTRDQHAKDAAVAQAEYDALTKAIDQRKADMEKAVRDAKLPLPNIGFGKTGLLLNKLPFKEASTAEQIRTAVALSVSMNPQLRLMWIRDASLLDDDSMAMIRKLAEEYDCTVLLETVRPQSGSAIVLVDGHVEGTEAAVTVPAHPTVDVNAVLAKQAKTKPLIADDTEL
jgi:hypothetical protein